MFVMGTLGELQELDLSVYSGRGRGRQKPSAALRRMRDVATPEDRDSDALLPPERPRNGNGPNPRQEGPLSSPAIQGAGGCETPVLRSQKDRSAALARAREVRADLVPVAEAEFALALWRWFNGAAWDERLCWNPDKIPVALKQDGDRLFFKGELLATRNPHSFERPKPGTFGANFGNARAICRVVLSGDYKLLYPKIDWAAEAQEG